MKKTIKFKNDTYLDTSSIVHGHQLLKDIFNNRITQIWSGKKSLGDSVIVSNYRDYDILLILVQTNWNRNGYIIVPKYQYNQEKNFEITLFSDSLCTFGYNPARLPEVSVSRLGNGEAHMTEIIGIRL